LRLNLRDQIAHRDQFFIGSWLRLLPCHPAPLPKFKLTPLPSG
jgi:hypothetical protein